MNTPTNHEHLSCGRCGRPTPYRLVVASEAKPCCGRLQCEAWVRDGTEAPALSPESNLVAVREERRRYHAFLVRVLEGVEILAKARRDPNSEIFAAVASQLRRDLLDALKRGAPEVAT